MRKDDAPIVIEQTINASIETVWNAITQVDQMRQWYFENIPSFKPEVGFETRFDVQNEDRHFLHVWTVTEVVAMKLIKYDWKYEGYPGDSFVVFELFTQDDLTKVRLAHHVLESFPDDIPEFQRESGVAGWTYFVKVRLKEFLETNN